MATRKKAVKKTVIKSLVYSLLQTVDRNHVKEESMERYDQNGIVNLHAKCYVQWKANSAQHHKHIVTIVKHDGGRIMLWESFLTRKLIRLVGRIGGAK